MVEVYLSRDFGETWTKIFTAPSIESWHIHGVKLDPYEDRIWVLNGDGASLCNARYSDDWGQTWTTLWQDGQCPVQFTDLIALPNCLIFGLDDPKGRGFMRLDKPSYRANAGDLRKHLHEAYFVDNIGTGAEATGRFVVSNRGSGPVAYLPYESPRGMLTATKDGYDYYVLWDYTQAIPGSREGLSYFGVTDAGKMVGYFRDNNIPYLWEADEPDWIEF